LFIQASLKGGASHPDFKEDTEDALTIHALKVLLAEFVGTRNDLGFM
jgi:hypothetical protein